MRTNGTSSRHGGGKLLPPDHIWVQSLRPLISRARDGRWAVQYRDFSTTKQDITFPDEASARRHARQLMIGPHIVDGMSPEDFEAADESWRRLDEELR